MKTKLVVSSGQYETAATVIIVNHKTWRGLRRRINQLQNEYAVYGDNWAGWIKANVALADDRDQWGDNQIIGGQWCEPHNGWLIDDDAYHGMTYRDLYKKIYGPEQPC